MALVEVLKKDLTTAVRAKEPLTIETLRGILSSIHNAEIEKKKELTDDEVLTVLNKEAKKRKEAIEVYAKAGRGELEKKEIAELAIIEKYLPPALTEDEIKEIVKRAAAGAGEDKNFGAVMKSVMAEVGGRAEAKIVSEFVKRELGSE